MRTGENREENTGKDESEKDSGWHFNYKQLSQPIVFLALFYGAIEMAH